MQNTRSSRTSAPEMTRLLRVSMARYSRAITGGESNEVHFEEAVDRLGERKEIDGDHFFVKLPSDRKWKAFMESAINVRSLDADKSYGPIFQVLFNMGRAHQSYPFPNLRSLKWTAMSNGELINISDLIVPTLDHFSLELHDLPPQFLRNIYQCLTARIPTLRCLQIGLPNRLKIALETVEILTNLLTFYSSTLIRVQIPAVLAIPSIIQCLSNLPNLCDMIVGSASVPLPSLIDPRLYVPLNRRGEFPSLRDFSYHGTPRTLYHSFIRSFNLSALSVFHWYLDDDVDELAFLVQTIVPACPRLTTLQIGQPGVYMPSPRPRQLPVIPWSIIKGLLECRDLTAISVHCAQVNMNRVEISKFLGNRTTWTKIEMYASTPLTFQDLFLYATYCPNLKALGMLVNIRSEDELIIDQDHSFTVTFPQLCALDLAHSNIHPRFCFTIGRLLHNISEKPVYVVSWDDEVGHNINKVIASRYIEEARAGKPLSDEERDYISTVKMEMENLTGMDFDDPDDD